MSEDGVIIPFPSIPFIHQPAELTARVYANLVERRAMHADGRVPGARTALAALDDQIGGYMAPGVYMIHGVPGVGKTGFVLQVAGECGTPALFITCEMSPEILWTRVASRVSKLPLRDLRADSIAPIEGIQQRLYEAMDLIRALTFVDARRELLPLPKLKAIIRSLQTPPGLIVLDSLHAWALANAGGKSEYEALNEGIKDLTDLSAEFDIPVLVVVERNRTSMASGGLSAGAGTRRIEYGCDVMLELKLEDDQPTTTPGFSNNMQSIQLRISKNRFGYAGAKIPLRFSMSLQTFFQSP